MLLINCPHINGRMIIALRQSTYLHGRKAAPYRGYHGYVALVVCGFGTLANLVNLAVLTRRELRLAPVNRILTGLAGCDVLVMLEYIPFAVYEYIILPERRLFPYGWAVFVLFHMHFSQLLHTISIALTLTLAVWRYIVVSRAKARRRLLCPVSTAAGGQAAAAAADYQQQAQPQHSPVFVSSSSGSRSERRADRTTRMLLAVLLLFLITEIPQGVLGLLSGLMGDCFFRSCYHSMGEFMDILALFNGAVNFILYCLMSRQFRQAFGQLFRSSRIVAKWQPPAPIKPSCRAPTSDVAP
ncbi:unnamed protein product [Trichogramma brassicae]|uniref:G-protein coupled receptors family 1 profile domain-containing protein n=1 Tax=Trichogramma brassicae TaxID=86971 RepID=A0A6H5IBU5_9HYME|nr:unnamed protein product [Trichogramma brassicae]